MMIKNRELKLSYCLVKKLYMMGGSVVGWVEVDEGLCSDGGGSGVGVSGVELGMTKLSS